MFLPGLQQAFKVNICTRSKNEFDASLSVALSQRDSLDLAAVEQFVPSCPTQTPKAMLGLWEPKPIGRIVRAIGRWRGERLRG